MHQVTTFIKALSDGNRLRLLSAVTRAGDLCVCRLTALLGVSGATCSRHLSLLVDAGLMDRRKDGRWMYYRSTVSRLDANRKRMATAALELFAGTEQGAADREYLVELLMADSETACGKKEPS